jgi:hypothetical protein
MVEKIDVDSNENVISEYSLTHIPTIILKENDMIIGRHIVDSFEASLDTVLKTLLDTHIEKD